MGRDSAHVTLGQENVNDQNKEFRLGVLPKEHPGKVWWHESGWMRCSETDQDTSTYVKKGDKVVVERRELGKEEIERMGLWDIAEQWPAEAYGPSTVVVPWYF